MSAWASWDMSDWNHRLLQHYFLRRPDGADAVVVLLTTAEELVRVTGDPSADADDVKDAFVASMLRAVRRDHCLLSSAASYTGAPLAPSAAKDPPFVAHLIFTCLAASESAEDLANEGSYIKRLRQLADGLITTDGLGELPSLWKNLVRWLAKHPDTYRQLVLPYPGGFTRIGHTIKLAFPDRRDQKALSEVLDSAELMGDLPPVSTVLAVIAKERTRFKTRFLEAFDDFRDRFQAADVSSNDSLLQHRFWAAVEAAALRGRGLSDGGLEGSAYSFIAQEADDHIGLILVADREVQESSFMVREIGQYGRWTHAVTSRGDDDGEFGSVDEAARRCLNGGLRLPSISARVDQGLLPFFEAPHGHLELATRETLAESRVVLVRDAALEALRRVVTLGRTARHPSYDGWTQVEVDGIDPIDADALEGTALARAWILHKSFPVARVHLAGGVRVDDGWLGDRHALPQVTAPDATSLVLTGEAGEVTLGRVDDATWRFPDADIVGEHRLVASPGGERRIRFHAFPSSEDFKPPSEPEAWFVESVSGTAALSEEQPALSASGPQQLGALTSRSTYLGRDVGEFVEDVSNATWVLRGLGSTLACSQGDAFGAGHLPVHRTAHKPSARRWRKLLGSSRPATSLTPAWREAMKIANHHHGELSVRADLGVAPLRSQRSFDRPRSETVRAVSILAGRASSRSGIRWVEWSDLLQRLLDVEVSEIRPLTRAWMETGLVDVVAFARWRRIEVFARRPRLVAWHDGGSVVAAVHGLVLESTLDALRGAARRAGAIYEPRYSVSNVVPAAALVAAEEAGQLVAVAKAAGLGVDWLDFDALSASVSRHDVFSRPPMHYPSVELYRNWQLEADREEPTEVTVNRHVSADRPAFWSTSIDGTVVWSYELDVLRRWIAVLMQRPLLEITEEGDLRRRHAHLPLPAARVAAALGVAMPGPTPTGGYLYPVGSRRLAERLTEVVARSHRLPLVREDQ